MCYRGGGKNGVFFFEILLYHLISVYNTLVFLDLLIDRKMRGLLDSKQMTYRRNLTLDVRSNC